MKNLAVLLVVGLALPAGTARADASRELIVRYEGAEAPVKLRYSSAEAASSALARLARSPEVASAQHLHLYKPLIHYTVQDVVHDAEEPSGFLYLPFASPLESEMPSVALPPVSPGWGPDPLVAMDWTLSAIHLPAGVVSGAGPTVAVVDTGVDYNHEDLAGAMWRAPGDPRTVGYDTFHDHARPYDVVHFDVQGCMKNLPCSLGTDTSSFLTNPGHGTHCAGHVGAVAGNGVGIRGVGAGSPVMALKFFRDFGEENPGQGDDAAAVKAIDYAITHGAKIISASWGGRMKRAEAQASELRRALERARAAGVLFVVAAGNDGIDQDSDPEPDFPAAFSEFDNLISVAALDSTGNLAAFSNYGATAVHLAAPGVKILSTTAGSRYSDVVARFKDPQGHDKEVDWSGTSMAAPLVAGAAALVWRAHPEESYAEIRARLLRGARPSAALAGKVASGGALDVEAALR
jgi:subtilisin family serine protease